MKKPITNQDQNLVPCPACKAEPDARCMMCHGARKVATQQAGSWAEEQLHREIVLSLAPGTELVHPKTGRVGKVDRCEREGIVHVWFGATRGAHVENCSHPEHVREIAAAAENERTGRVVLGELDPFGVQTAQHRRAACTDPSHGATGDGARICEPIHYRDLEPG